MTEPVAPAPSPTPDPPAATPAARAGPSHVLRAAVAVALLLLVAAAAGLAYVWHWSERPARTRARTIQVPRTPELVARGKYVAQVSCALCHGTDLAGGKEFTLPIVHSWASNVSSDPGTGVGGWTDGQLEEALRRGVRPDGRVLRAPMPLLEGLSDEDLFAVIAYLRSVPPVSRASRLPELTFTGRLALALGHVKPKHVVATNVPAPPRGPTKEYGAYLASSVMLCADCHHPRRKGQPIADKLWAGGLLIEEPGEPDVLSSNLTPDRVEGIGAWTAGELALALREGKTPSGRLLARAMPRYPATDEDVQALHEFLKSVAPVSEHVLSPEAVKGSALYSSKGCISCHGPDGKGPRADVTKVGREGDTAKIIAWIKDPAAVKPGTAMPKLGIEDPAELQALARFIVEVSGR